MSGKILKNTHHGSLWASSDQTRLEWGSKQRLRSHFGCGCVQECGWNPLRSSPVRFPRRLLLDFAARRLQRMIVCSTFYFFSDPANTAPSFSHQFVPVVLHFCCFGNVPFQIFSTFFVVFVSSPLSMHRWALARTFCSSTRYSVAYTGMGVYEKFTT